MPNRDFPSMRAFYPFYLSQHRDCICRRLHFIGTSLSLLIAIAGIVTGHAWLFLLALLQGYAWAWIGHFFFEHNRPATFSHPLYSLIGDWWMWADILRGRIRF